MQKQEGMVKVKNASSTVWLFLGSARMLEVKHLYTSKLVQMCLFVQ